MENQVIEVLDREHGEKVIEYFKSLGIYRGYREGICSRQKANSTRFYGVINGKFSNYSLNELPNNTHIITLPPEYPKVMYVWNYGSDTPKKRVVFMEKNGNYLAWTNSETFSAAEKCSNVSYWTYAKDIEPEPEIRITATVNDKPIKLTDISAETWLAIRKADK